MNESNASLITVTEVGKTIKDKTRIVYIEVTYNHHHFHLHRCHNLIGKTHGRDELLPAAMRINLNS